MILIFGQTGQVARELARLLPDAVFLGRDRADLTDPVACAAAIGAGDYSAVINAAAYTAVDRAETDAQTARLVNADAPGAMARACAARGIPFLHVSTDYVFDGSGSRPWHPGDPTGPLGVYGATKLAGEDAVRASGARAAILRTSWVFSAHGSNFVKTMLRLGAERDRLTIVADQIGGPTPAAAITRALVTMAAAMQGGQPGGTYHLSGAPDTSWADFAREIFRQSGLSCQVEDIPTAAYPTPAKRPANSRLNCDSLTADFGIARPDWRDGLTTVLAELKG
ncbi:dTDP-4-dehydrorhamnose reductase [Paracoccus sp. p4-l81]|uniref:dTDP-4-dehydrorhamnose reductase n=1 Tax=unclassified Paracoccus (in: a-proteobacteria) TaxID=2688777 RepID=UPI0035B91F1F